MRALWMVLAGVALISSGCATQPGSPTPEVQRTLAPTGTLRIGVIVGPPAQMIVDPVSGEARGVTYDLGHEFAKRLSVPFEAVPLRGNAEFTDALKSGRVDFAANNATPARAAFMDFAQPHLFVEAGYLVPSGSPISGAQDVDRPGIRFGVTQGSTSEAKFARELKNAVLVRAASVESAVKMLADGQLDVYATNKANLYEMADKLAGSRVLDGRYGLEQLSIGIPKGRDAGMPFLRQFVEDAKAQGMVAAAVRRAKLRGVVEEPR
jgi:polar amino acid transport system substrate-binding protein